MNDSNDACDSHDTIRPSSSSLTRAPSWSLGVGANQFSSSPDDGSNGVASPPDSSRDPSNRRFYSSSELAVPFPKLTIHIPTVYLTKKDPSSSSYHVYQLSIKTSAGVEWSVYRRYSQFYALHQQLKTKDSAIGKLQFPPKRRLNSKASTIVQERRRKLEEYICSLNSYIDGLPPASSGGAPLQRLNNLAARSDSPPVDRAMSNLPRTNSLPDSSCSEDQSAYQNSSSIRQSTGSRRVADDSPERPREEPEPNDDDDDDDELVVDQDSPEEENVSVVGLYHNFISLKGKRDDDFDPACLND